MSVTVVSNFYSVCLSVFCSDLFCSASGSYSNLAFVIKKSGQAPDKKLKMTLSSVLMVTKKTLIELMTQGTIVLVTKYPLTSLDF